MKIIVISPSKTIANEAQVVTAFFENGLELFHLRKPFMSTKEMAEYLEKIPTHFHNRIVIHSHHNLTKKFNLKGIHLTRKHLKRKFYTSIRLRLLKIRRPYLTISTSFRNLAGIYKNQVSYKYALLGTIFDITSGNFYAGYNKLSLTAALGKANVPIIARGGTSLENMQICHDLRFSGMVFYSGVWKTENPLTTLQQILEKNSFFSSIIK